MTSASAKLFFTVAIASLVSAAEQPRSASEFTALAKSGDRGAVTKAIFATFQDGDLWKGTAVISEGPDFFWALRSPQPPKLVLDDGAPMDITDATGGIYYHSAQLTVGRTHSYYYLINGVRTGGKTDLAAYLPDSYEQPGVPQGKISKKLVHSSSIYPDMKSDYWIYVPAEYDPNTPAAVMIWQDGEGHVERNGAARTLNVIDNLTFQKKIPVMINIFISPGVVGEKKMRSIEYDTVSDAYPKFLRDEILAEVGKHYNLRKDGYSRGIAGESSGGICAFNAAWFMPDEFSRVISRIGSFTSIQWKTGAPDGGNDYPFKVRKESKRNIRVWLQDGYNDLENDHGSWPLQNIQMANSLKLREYDFHFSFGTGTHTRLGGSAEEPTELIWLWRGYNANRKEAAFEIEPEEKSLPMFRVRLAPRE